MRSTIGILLFVVACAPAEQLRLPVPPDSAQALLLALDPPRCESGTCTFAYLYDGTEPDRALVLPAEDAVFYAAYFDDDLATLALPPGPLNVCLDRSSAIGCMVGLRRLPSPSTVYGAALEGRDLRDFNPQMMLPPSIAELQVPAIDRVECAAVGRCFDAPPVTGEEPHDLRCVPCRTPPNPLPPQAPPAIEPPAEVRFECPSTWTARELVRASVCDPPAQSAELNCPSDQFQFYGTQECVAPGDVCPSGNFADAVPPGAIYVLAGASGPGTGTENDPLGALQDALAIAPAGQAIALGPGVYTACAIDGVTLLGTCAARVVIDARACPQSRLILGGDVALAGATIEGTLELEAAAGADLRGLLIRGHGSAGILALEDCTLNASDLAITDCSQAISLFAGTSALQRVAITESGVGVGAFSGARAAIEDLRISRTSYPVLAREGANVTLDRADIRSRFETVLSAQRATLTLRDVSATAGPGIGLAPVLSADSGASVVIERAVFRGARGVAVSLLGGGGERVSTAFDHLVIAGVALEGARGHGIETSGGVDLRMERTLIEGAPIRGVSQSGTGSLIGAFDLVVLPGSEPGSEPIEKAITLDDTHGEIRGLYLTRTATAGLELGASTLYLTDATMLDHHNNAITLRRGSTFDVDRAYLEQTANAGVFAHDRSVTGLRDIEVKSARIAFAGTGTFHVYSAGVAAAGGVYRGENGTLNIQNARLVDAANDRAAIYALGGAVSLTRVVIEDADNGGLLGEELTDASIIDVSMKGSSFTPALVIDGLGVGTRVTITRSVFEGGAARIRLCSVTALIDELDVRGGGVGMELGAATVGLRNFRVTGANRGVVFFGPCSVGPNSFFAQNGIVSASEVALEVPESLELTDAFYQVIYDAPVPIQVIDE